MPRASGSRPRRCLAFGRFIAASAAKLKEVRERRLEDLDIVAVFIDGKFFAQDMIVTALGIASKGEKKMLGFTQTTTEDQTACRELLQSLVDRGLQIEDGLLFILDGGKGLRKAVSLIFGRKTPVQRCQWHKRENVISHLPPSRRAGMRLRLLRARELPDGEKAKVAVLKIHGELLLQNESAAASLLDGLEETLSLQKLGLFRELGWSFKTTNVIESVQSGLGQRRWRVSQA